MSPVFHFTASKLHFVCFDETDRNDDFTLAVPVDDVPEVVRQNCPDAYRRAVESSWRLFNFRTKMRPMIFGQKDDMSDLIGLHAIMLATNISWDVLLRGATAEIAGTFFEKTHRGVADPMGASLRAVRIDPAKVALPTWGQVISGN